MFVNKLHLYVNYLKTDINNHLTDINDKKRKYLDNFKLQLECGIEYYKQLIQKTTPETELYKQNIQGKLEELEIKLDLLKVPISIKN